MSTTLNSLVRKQILAESPDIASAQYWANQAQYNDACVACDAYVDEQLNTMNNVELLERISIAQEQLTLGLSVRLGI